MAAWVTGPQAGRSGNRYTGSGAHPPTLLVTGLFCWGKAPRAEIGGILDTVSQNCNVCGNVIGLLYGIFILFEFQPMPCLCIAGWKVRLVTDLLLHSAGPSASHFYISGVTFCIPVTRYEHVHSHSRLMHGTSICHLWREWQDKRKIAGKALNVTAVQEHNKGKLHIALRPTKRVTSTLHVNNSSTRNLYSTAV
jgi:hypothetical protein